MTLPVKLRQKDWLMYNKWEWHLVFWFGYILIRFWAYYLAVQVYGDGFVSFLLLSEALFIAVTYYTFWLYDRLFRSEQYLIYYSIGTISWLLYLYGRTHFQVFYFRHDKNF